MLRIEFDIEWELFCVTRILRSLSRNTSRRSQLRIDALETILAWMKQWMPPLLQAKVLILKELTVRVGGTLAALKVTVP